MHPMDPAEAVMQMDLVGHTFFMFQNADTGRHQRRLQAQDLQLRTLEPIEVSAAQNAPQTQQHTRESGPRGGRSLRCGVFSARSATHSSASGT